MQAFAKPDFDSHTWINNFLNNLMQESTPDKDPIQSVSSAVLKLQAAFHETESEIRTLAEELPVVMPR